MALTEDHEELLELDEELLDELSDEAEAVFASTIESLEAMYEDKLNAEAAEQAAREAAEAEAARVAAEAERLRVEREAFEAEQKASREAAKAEADRLALEAAIEADRLAEERQKLEAERLAFEELRRSLEPKPEPEPVYSAAIQEQLDESDAVIDEVFAPLEEMAETPVVYVPPVVDGISLQDAANVMCGQLPPGYIVHLAMENGAAWVMLFNDEGEEMVLPDAADKSIARQLGDALVVALGE